MLAVRLSLGNVGDMYLHHRDADGTDAVGKGDGSVGVGSRIHHHGIILPVSLLQLVNQHAFVVRLEIGKLMQREALAQFGQVILEGNGAIDFRLSFA